MTSHKAEISYYVYSDCNNATALTCLHREADGESVLDSVLNPRGIHHSCDRVTADVHVLGSLFCTYADCSLCGRMASVLSTHAGRSLVHVWYDQFYSS